MGYTPLALIAANAAEGSSMDFSKYAALMIVPLALSAACGDNVSLYPEKVAPDNHIVVAGSDGDIDPGDGSPPPDGTSLTYPAGPYGKTAGTTIPNITWKGYRDGTGDWTDISLLDYYDPDGSRGITALLIETAAQW